MSAAHIEALDFYTANFPHYTLQKPLLHIANSASESEKLSAFKASTDLKHSQIPQHLRSLIHSDAFEFESIYLDNGAVVDAQKICEALAKDADFYTFKADQPRYEGNTWEVGLLKGKHLVLTTGAYPKVLRSDSVKLRAIWGHRIDIRTTTQIPSILHHFVSISPTAKDIVAIGATHDVHFNPFESMDYNYDEGREILLEKARKTLKLDNINILRDYTGLRSGTFDYYPICGALVDEDATIKRFSSSAKRFSINDCVNYPNTWMINGSGGYGFVLAPFLARKLAEAIVEEKEIDKALSPGRFLVRELKRHS